MASLNSGSIKAIFGGISNAVSLAVLDGKNPKGAVTSLQSQTHCALRGLKGTSRSDEKQIGAR